MNTGIHITVLAENSAGAAGLMGEHGLAFWIEVGDRRILFDTGQGLVLEHNASKLGIDLSQADDLVLSHGHYDHTGGLPRLLPRLSGTRVYVHPAAFERKFHLAEDGKVREVGSPPNVREALEQSDVTRVSTTEATEIIPGLQVTGEIPRCTDYEDTGGRFFKDADCTVADPLLDDQALVIRDGDRIVVILGCTHSGLVNTLKHAATMTGTRRIHAILGGMHLLNASPERIERSLDALERYGCDVIGPCHCTGLRAVAAMLGRWPERIRSISTGTRLVI